MCGESYRLVSFQFHSCCCFASLPLSFISRSVGFLLAGRSMSPRWGSVWKALNSGVLSFCSRGQYRFTNTTRLCDSDKTPLVECDLLHNFFSQGNGFVPVWELLISAQVYNRSLITIIMAWIGKSTNIIDPKYSQHKKDEKDHVIDFLSGQK